MPGRVEARYAGGCGLAVAYPSFRRHARIDAAAFLPTFTPCARSPGGIVDSRLCSSAAAASLPACVVTSTTNTSWPGLGGRGFRGGSARRPHLRVEGIEATFDRDHRVRHRDVHHGVTTHLQERSPANVLLEQLIPFDDDVGLRAPAPGGAGAGRQAHIAATAKIAAQLRMYLFMKTSPEIVRKELLEGCLLVASWR